MANRNWDEPADNDADNLGMLLTVAAGILLKSPDPAPFLDWIADAGPTLAPELAMQVDPRTGPTGLFFRTIGVAIYNAMPQPEADFRPLKLPEPGRNEPCLCGSGNKYKRCCLPLAGTLDLSGFNLLRLVLDNIPQKQFKTLPHSHADPIAIYDTAVQWNDEGNIERAVKLLEPWFGGNGTLNGNLEPLFDELMDCYLDLGNSRKRERLITQVIERGDSRLRAVALHRRSMMLADNGDPVAAWEVFLEAQRLDPDSPALVPLELTLLMSQGKVDKVRERARFWVARLERMRDPGLAQLIDFVRDVQDDPQAALSSIEREHTPGLGELVQLVAAAPVVITHYTVEDDGDRDGMLHGTTAMRKLEQRWSEIFPQIKPPSTATQNFYDEMWDEPEDWLDFLRDNPIAWQSFDVIDDLVLAVDALQSLGTAATLLETLLARGVTLLNVSLATAPLGTTLSWGWLDNRPALRLLAHKAFRALNNQPTGPTSDDFIEHAEMLLRLNPNDNHGIRESLSLAYLVRGWPEKVIELTNRFPDDFCGPTLNRVLAHLRLGHDEQARVELAEVADRHEVALKMLLAKNPKEPKSVDGFGIALGGKQEAWLYRASARALWEQDGALEWLAKARRKIRRS